MLTNTRPFRSRRLRYWGKIVADLLTPLSHDAAKWETKNSWLRKTGIDIGKGVAIDRGFFCFTGSEENITIEDYAAIGMGVHVWNYNSVKIGAFSMFASEVSLVNGNHTLTTFEPYSGALVIGRGCWIGNGARILGPVTVGDNSIVGAGSLVNKNVPECAIVAGVPATIIGMRTLPERVWHFGGIHFDPRTFEIVP